jgi:hypothetical protein
MNNTVPVSHSDFEEPEEWDAVHYHEEIDGKECTITAVEMENTVTSIYRKYECTECDETYYAFDFVTQFLAGIVFLSGSFFFSESNPWIAVSFFAMIYISIIYSQKLAQTLEKAQEVIYG